MRRTTRGHAAAALLASAALAVATLSALSPAAATDRTERPARVDRVERTDNVAERAAARRRANNPWLHFRVANMAHSGGEREAPMNTLYAFKRAQKRGSNMLELDVQTSKDRRLMVIHDSTVDDTTNGTGYVKDMDLMQLRKLDAAHWFVPKVGVTHDAAAGDYRLRGARYGKVSVKGYTNRDFRIPTLGEVFNAFPQTPVNIEIKGTADDDVASFERTARRLARVINKTARTDVIVTSFNDEALALFHELAPQVGLAPGRNALIGYYLGGAPLPEGTVALQIPVTFSGITVANPDFIARAHADGYAVHVWFSGTAPDDRQTYWQMITACADGVMAARPTLLERILDNRDITRPDDPGIDPCA